MSHTYKADGALPDPIREEFSRLQRALNDAQPEFNLKVLHAEPVRTREGQCVLADGTDWDPGSGAGLYIFRAGVWVFIG